ncbi:MAG: hypothetical protein U0165_09630 [Polyangiaceae bacterium]
MIVDACEREEITSYLPTTPMSSLSVTVDADAPSPPSSVTLGLALPPRVVQARSSFVDPSSSLPETASTRSLTGVTFSGSGTTITLSLASATASEAKLWDLRSYPRENDDVIVGDPNGNGKAGAKLGWRQIKAGDPARVTSTRGS